MIIPELLIDKAGIDTLLALSVLEELNLMKIERNRISAA